MKLIRTITLIGLFSASLLMIVPAAHAQTPSLSDCESTNVGPLELHSGSSLALYSATVYLYRGATLTFSELAGTMHPSVIDISSGTLSSPGAASSFTFVVPTDGYYTIRVEPSLGYTMFSVRCTETPLHPSCRLLDVEAMAIPDSYTSSVRFYGGEIIFINTTLPFELYVNSVLYTHSTVTFFNFTAPAGKYKLVVKSTGSNFANYIRCEHL